MTHSVKGDTPGRDLPLPEGYGLGKEHRRPIGEIPKGFKCPICAGTEHEREFKMKTHFRNHMAKIHNTYYETVVDGQMLSHFGGLKRTVEIEDPKDLKLAHRIAIAKTMVLGEDLPENASTRHAWASPAGQKYRAEIKALMGDTKTIVRQLLETHTLQMYLDWLVAFDLAKKAGDYKSIHKMVAEVGLLPVLKEAGGDDTPRTINITLSAGAQLPSTSVAEVVTSYRVLEAAVEDDDPDGDDRG